MFGYANDADLHKCPIEKVLWNKHNSISKQNGTLYKT